jgi:hypothetical protein
VPTSSPLRLWTTGSLTSEPATSLRDSYLINCANNRSTEPQPVKTLQARSIVGSPFPRSRAHHWILDYHSAINEVEVT